jgi:hypothetical protein
MEKKRPHDVRLKFLAEESGATLRELVVGRVP